jgi:hypothetical protein
VTPDALKELDIQVASIEAKDDPTIKPLRLIRDLPNGKMRGFNPTRCRDDWAQLVEKYRLSLRFERDRWLCSPPGRLPHRSQGETIGVAVCRAVIALKGEKL